MASSSIRPPQPLVIDNNIAENWKLFKLKWENFAIITSLADQPMKYQIAMLLHVLGDEALKAYHGFQFSKPEKDRTVEDILEHFEEFAVGEINVTYQRFLLNRRDQKEGETFENFLADVRTLIKTCDYCQTCFSSILRDRLVLGIKDPDTQGALLRERKLTLEKCIDICRSAESVTIQSQSLRPDTINKVTGTSKKSKYRYQKSGSRQKSTESGPIRECRFCARRHEMKKEACPAWGKSCAACKRMNHFAASEVCSMNKKKKSQQVNKVSQAQESSSESEEPDDDVEWISNIIREECDSVNSIGSSHRDIMCRMLVNGRKVTFQVDTGARINTLPENLAINISPTTRKLKMYNQMHEDAIGTTRMVVSNPKNDKKYSMEFVVVKDHLGPIIGLKAAEQMGLISVNEENVDRIASIGASSPFARYEEVFDPNKLGSLPGIQTLKVDESVKPVLMANRRVPVALKNRVKDELTRLERLGVIARVEGPTKWLSQLVITEKKSGELRICMDPRELNKALMREHYTIPVLDDMLHELSDSRFFSKADLAAGYWHVRLDYESSMMTTFQTCHGLYRWCRLPFGLSVSSEIFQKKLIEAINGLSGVLCIADDIVIHGKTKEQHDQNLENFLARCMEKGIKLNKNKFELRMKEITFMGHRVTQEGLKSDPEKIRAIQDMPRPANVCELQRFLGMVNYLAKFVQNMTSVLHPLHNLLKADTTWIWSDTQEAAFMEIKDMLTKAPVLAFYNPAEDLVLENDASEYGLGSALFQKGRPVAFASRSLTEVERRYAQIEKEMLGVSFGLQKFHAYTYGRHVHVITDHKPLVAIVKKPLSKAPRRLQALLLRTQEYNYSLSYQPGPSIPVADQLSRAPLAEKATSEVVHVNNLSFQSIKIDELEAIRMATEKDSTLCELKDTIMKGWPIHKAELSEALTQFHSYRDELVVQDGIILRGERVVIPLSMRKDIKKKVHAGHGGINSCLRRARELVYWPRMSAEIRQYVESCSVCAEFSTKQAPEPLQVHEVPKRPWERVGTDLFAIEGRNYLITVDYFSQFFEIDFLSDTTSQAVITKLKNQFARHGIPDVLVSDGGPQYSSQSFKEFSETWGFVHKFSSPGNSKANGCAEAAVKIAKRLMKKCQKNKEDPYLGLLNLRNTPQEELGTSPVMRLMSRRTKTIVPTTTQLLMPGGVDWQTEKEKKEKKQNKMAQRYVERRSLRPLQVGEKVRMQPIHSGETEWREARVTKRIKSRTYEVRSRNRLYRRNRQFLRTTGSHKSEPEAAGSIIGNHAVAQTFEDAQVMPHQTEPEIRQSPVPAINNAPVCRPSPGGGANQTQATEQLSYTTRSGRVSKKPKRLDL